MNETQDRWWAPVRVAIGEGWRWHLGPFHITVYRADNEWRISHDREEGDGPAPGLWSRERSPEVPEDSPNLERYAAGADTEELRLRPRVADRSLVALPRTPLYVLPGEQAKVYVSSPLWIDIEVGPPPRSLREVPIKRLSDTWVGGSTIEGEVAYALKTYGRVRLEEVPKRSHRCITPVVFANQGVDMLRVERMNLPIPYLSLFASADGDLWSQGVLLERSEDDEMARLEITPGAPPEAEGAERVAEARQKAEPKLLVRAFSSLLRTFGENGDNG